MMALEASLRLDINWQKTEVQALGSSEDEPLTVTVLRQDVAVIATTQKALLISHVTSLERLCKT